SEPHLANRLVLGYFVVPGTKVAKAPHAGIEARLHAERCEWRCRERLRFCHLSVKDRCLERLRLVRSRPTARTPVSGSRFGRLFGIHQIAKLFGRLEVRHALGRHLHSLPSLRIAPNPRIPLPYTERPKAANLDLVAGLQRMDHGIEDRLNNDLAVAPRQISETGHFLDQVRL